MSSFDKTPLFARDTVEASCKYMNYMDRQVKEMEGWRRNQDFRCVLAYGDIWNAMTDLQVQAPRWFGGDTAWYFIIVPVQHSVVAPLHMSCVSSPPIHFISPFFFLRSRPFRIPADIVYTHERLPSMSSEELEKLNQVRPETFAAASQMQGITPHSLVYLYNHVTRRRKVPCVCGTNVV